jgi:hypothetical protein
MTKQDTIMPAFIFCRRRDIEIEAGFTLAGMLIVDIPKGKKMNKRRSRMVQGYVQALIENAQSGQMPDNAIIYGWPGGARPPNACRRRDRGEGRGFAEPSSPNDRRYSATIDQAHR